MGVNSLSKTVIRQRCDCDLNPDPSAAESSTLTTRLKINDIFKSRGRYAAATTYRTLNPNFRCTNNAAFATENKHTLTDVPV